MPAQIKKDTLYVDIEDDITAIIDRVNTSTSKIVALVLPKRAQMLHSSVNMRLLKRAADNGKKQLVLITNEETILALAGTVSVYTATSLTSKPIIPKNTGEVSDEVVSIDAPEESDESPIDESRPIGELAAAAAVGATVATIEKDSEVIELDDEEVSETGDKSVLKKEKKDRKLKVPNFDSFRNKLFAGIGVVVALLVLGFFALSVWPRATIVITTETKEVPSSFTFVANTAVKEIDEEKNILPATIKEIKQTDKQTVVPSGKKDIGSRAKGFVSLVNCNKEDETVSLPAGTRLVVGSAAFLTDSAVSIPASNFTGGGVCKEDITRDVDVTAELGGDVYNLSARDGYTAPGSPDVSGFGSAMTGGTTNIVRVVSADDVESAKQKLLLRNTDQVKNQLQQQLKETSLFPLPTTFTSANSEPSSTPAVNEQGDSATVTMEFTYTMLGVPEADFTKLLSKSQEGKIDTGKEKIYDTGTSKATMSVAEKRSPSDMTVSYSGVALVGPILDADAIARDIAGKPGGETKQIIESRPGIVSADVRYSPFYVFSTPDRLNRIQITFQVDGENVQ